jgi:hypothetical protein
VQANACSPKKGLAGNELRYSIIYHKNAIAKWGHGRERVNKLDFNLQRLELCPRIHLSWTAAGFLKKIDTVRQYDYGR